MVSARVRREQVAFVETRGLSRRRACALLSVARSTVSYQSRLVAKDAPVVNPMPRSALSFAFFASSQSKYFTDI